MRNRGGGDEDEAPSKKKSPGRIAYEKMMQQKRIVGALQAEQNAKAPQATKITKAAQADMTEVEKLAVYKQTPEYLARQESLKEYERQKALESHRAGEWNAVAIAEAYKEQEQAKQNAGGGKPLAVPVKNDNPPTWWDKIQQTWEDVRTWTSDHVVQPVKDVVAEIKKISFIFYNASGQNLIDPATEDETLRAPDIAAMKTYIAAAINVQRGSLNTDHKGPAQLSKTELNAEYGKPYFNKKHEIQGYGLGLPGTNPYDPEIAVAGMDNRVKQVLEYAENQSEKKGVNLSSTDKFIIVALAQNGGGFDLNDIQDAMLPKYIESGQIDWDIYFDMRQEGWDRRVGEAWKNPFALANAKTLFQNYFRTDGDDYNTKFMLEEFYEKSLELQNDGYYLPDDLDVEQIEALIHQSIGAEVGQ